MEEFAAVFDVMIVYPELTHFEELRLDPRWIRGCGVLMPHSVCGSNKFVELDVPSLLHGNVKFFHDVHTSIAIVGSRYKCSNPDCERVRARATNLYVDLSKKKNRSLAAEFAVSFVGYTTDQLQQMGSMIRLNGLVTFGNASLPR